MKEYKDLRSELLAKRGEIYANQLTMSVGEVMNLYENKEINLEPAFQRLFRWNTQQETNFVESILLGYPIPAIFVLQREDGIWDVIDGVQRLSTICHFSGILRNIEKSEEKMDPLKLENAKILTKLQGKYFMSKDQDECLDTSTRIDFKRSTFPVIVLKHGSEKNSKYELFKRLNTGGSHLSPQEIRNALILMYNENVYNKMDNFCKDDNFKALLSLSDNKLELRMDMDILTRFIVMRNYKNIEDVQNTIEINEFLDDAINEIISKDTYNIDNDLYVFSELISFLQSNVDEEYGFKVYSNVGSKFKGAFNWFIFETVIWGLTVINDVSVVNSKKEEIINKIKELKGTGQYQQSKSLSNLKVIQRLKEAKIEAEEVFKLNV
ncbi:DUF262 domain-containing protein [Clostridium felsineum]|uniref:GmrSD restriction endonucleases N-terminal domain-containing protein n=1 Tax=Clostridium felsineum TaxID=36839 RepID=A0A1S8LSC8_9CLOT|nr:DUF262 domain-containing protein [Clostridium felsineum]URZ04706.1 hypothetical protein CLROS_000150 [Clostridium felsineum]URZ09679.1 hypothetical protein CROST_003720 [Clostridium felsineum]